MNHSGKSQQMCHSSPFEKRKSNKKIHALFGDSNISFFMLVVNIGTDDDFIVKNHDYQICNYLVMQMCKFNGLYTKHDFIL